MIQQNQLKSNLWLTALTRNQKTNSNYVWQPKKELGIGRKQNFQKLLNGMSLSTISIDSQQLERYSKNH